MHVHNHQAFYCGRTGCASIRLSTECRAGSSCCGRATSCTQRCGRAGTSRAWPTWAARSLSLSLAPSRPGALSTIGLRLGEPCVGVVKYGGVWDEPAQRPPIFTGNVESPRQCLNPSKQKLIPDTLHTACVSCAERLGLVIRCKRRLARFIQGESSKT